MAHTDTSTDTRIPLWVWLIVLSAFLAATISFGVRSGFGLFVLPITAEWGWSIATLSLALAIQNLMWGVAQPFAGMVADRFGAPLVLIVGALIYASGLWSMTTFPTEWMFHLSAGFLIGIAQACIGFPVVMGVIAKVAPPEHRGLFMGIGTAGGSFGQLVFAPVTRSMLDRFSWQETLHLLAMIVLGVCILGMIIAVAKTRLGQRPQTSSTKARHREVLYPIEGLKKTLAHALREQGFLLLIAGFFVCGFQLAFIVVHLPAFAVLCGMTTHVAATGIALIGGFNIIGTIIAGMLGDRMRPKIPLAYIYLMRSVATLPLVLLPVAETSIYLFSIAMGLLWLSTVPLTNGVIHQFYGQKHAGTLFGIVFLSHQIGSFFGVYFSGLLFDATGSYDATWWGSIFMGVFAFVVNLLIKDRREPLKPAAA